VENAVKFANYYLKPLESNAVQYSEVLRLKKDSTGLYCLLPDTARQV
jgi:hypothetical protein